MIALAKKDGARGGADGGDAGWNRAEQICQGSSWPVFRHGNFCEGHLTAMAAGMAKTGCGHFRRSIRRLRSEHLIKSGREVRAEQYAGGFLHGPGRFVGMTGRWHHGFMDQAFLRPMRDDPHWPPATKGLNRALNLALSLDTASAPAVSRDNVPTEDLKKTIQPALRKPAAPGMESRRSGFCARVRTKP